MSAPPQDTRLGASIAEVLFSAEAIASKVSQMGAALAAHYEGKRPLVVGILNGCFPFIADLVRAMDIELEVDFMSVSSYGAGTKSTGVVRFIKDLEEPIEGRHVLLVEDIIDTGLTLRYLTEALYTRKPASIEVCALLDKQQARTQNIEVQWRGFVCPDAFVVGYGLDYAGRYRNLPYVGVLDPSVYTKG
ncbi:hypoxanthine phosphoribosyltransferase [Paraliomyxa miuraensis]|uniref:hypoxanthine phosphoribosyltransferase n=1 Tax=Paraliomyxa miuraensis TaxID=376150 RepID=UPI002253AA65|nr:hypoxanthine phosphoribosyltransferase [Paraliomyxa miuraensis]MCX4245237.1 hypoxanthine phosphoribosyltransferase [Paraliomyxa miuraensis]